MLASENIGTNENGLMFRNMEASLAGWDNSNWAAES
jgi:hypothetical protein